MEKENKSNSVWDDGLSPSSDAKTVTETKQETKSTTKTKTELKPVKSNIPEFDLDGLMTDFPTATELQRFVYDRTGYALELKGRSNKFKYQTALDVLNGQVPPQELLSEENPYVDPTDIIPEEPIKDLPPKDPLIIAAGAPVHKFDAMFFPHPDPELRSEGINAQVTFRKYGNNMITYEILGPITKKAVGTRINKYGKEQPAKFVWIDPRNGEQVIRKSDGTYTPLGTKLRAFMRKQKLNRDNDLWDAFIDRDFIANDTEISDNPWTA